MREFWLCDRDPKGVALLEEIKTAQTLPKRRIEVLSGDFNERIHDILGAGTIKPTTATFALLDQRSFQCDWATVRKIAGHKKTHKIEIFYFLATGWLDRSIATVSRPETIERLNKWWGRDDWRDLRKVSSAERGPLVAERFKAEFGYTYAYPYPIHSERLGGRIMYHMIHATDHEAATPLMLRAYRKISGRTLDDRGDQHDLEALLAELRDKDALGAGEEADGPIVLTTGDDVSAQEATDGDQSQAPAETPIADVGGILERLDAGEQARFGQTDEPDLRRSLRDAALRLAAALEERRPRHGEMGHNRPPLDDGGNPLPADFVNEIQEATKTIAEETAKATPDALEIAKAASRLDALRAWLQPRAALFADEFAKKAGATTGAAVVTGAGIACATLVPALHALISASVHWLAAVLSVL